MLLDDGEGGVPVQRTARVVAGLATGVLLLAGCASAHEPAVERVAATFEDPGADPAERCDLLAPATRAALEQDEAAPCAEAIEDLSLDGGAVRSVEIWGRDAQVRLADDTVFLAQFDGGWRVVAAVCTPQPEAPYECEVDGP
jgi:hypothetical protein